MIDSGLRLPKSIHVKVGPFEVVDQFEISVFSVSPVVDDFCAFFHHEGTEHTEKTQRKLKLTQYPFEGTRTHRLPDVLRLRLSISLFQRITGMGSQQKSSVSAALSVSQPAPLVEVRRGNIVESRHRGHISAVEPDGTVVAFAGNPGTVTYLRSSAKPHQAIPLVASGAADRFGFTEAEVALACASHSGEPIHTETAASMLKKIGLDESALKCGVHEPFSAEVTRGLRERKEQPNVLQNNCSGKHAGMLALALHLEAPTETYYQPDHPVQIAIKRCVAEFSDVPVNEIAIGIDGCGVPVFAVSVASMALMIARLISPPDTANEKTKAACRRIVNAMIAHPELIGGTSNRLDTELMRAANGALISKVGAEGVSTVGILPTERWPCGIGLALKIEDGDDHRARPTVVIEALRQLGILEGTSLAAVSQYSKFAVCNRRGDQVGEVRANFELTYGSPRLA